VIELRTERLTLYVPEILNDGSPVAYELLEVYERELLELAGGFTLTNGIGVWRSRDDVVYREPVRLYSIDAPTASNVRKAVTALALRIGHELGQEVVYLTVVPVEQVLIEVGVTWAAAQPAVTTDRGEIRVAGAGASAYVGLKGVR
jgi:hypothetical protein